MTAFVRRAAVRRSIMDYPNERSSHAIPTPRGGGLAISSVVLLFLTWAAARGHMSGSTGLALGVGGLVISVVGWLDDLKPVAATHRLAVHMGAALWTTAWLGGLPILTVGTGNVQLGLLGVPLAVLGLVWSTNLFNFMDGTDGIASIEAISVAGIGGFLLFDRGGTGLALTSLVVAAACLGFLWFNWSPARIFMGDIGSGFLGFILAAIALASETSGGLPLLVWALLGGVFIVDATITFARRLRDGHWRVPHRLHAYQRLVQAGWSHRKVAIAVALLNAALGVLAAIMADNAELTWPCLVAGFAMVIAAYVWVERILPFSASAGPS